MLTPSISLMRLSVLATAGQVGRGDVVQAALLPVHGETAARGDDGGRHGAV